ncbi:MAG: NAD(P)H-hydrate dehydratase [Elusimicrobiota bacterium]
MKITKKYFKGILGKRKPDTSKYDYGHVLVIAGSKSMTGCVSLAGLAALRTGAGLVTCAVPESIYPIVANSIPEIMTLPMPVTKNGTLSSKAQDTILDFIKTRRVASVVLGPGLSKDKTVKAFIRNLIERVTLPTILDADGINAFEGMVNLEKQIKHKSKLVITPHYYEFARFLGLDVDFIKSQKKSLVKKIAQRNNLICVLKGYHTIISDGNDIIENTTGNSGMATAGTGDVLSGMLGALCADPDIEKKKDLLKRIAYGVFLHGLAGDLAVNKYGKESLIASDIIEFLPEAMKALA